MPGEENPALRWGLTGAIGLTIIGILDRGPILLTGSDLLGAASDRAQAGAAAFYLAIGCLSLIAYPAILFTVGILAARGTGTARSGASAGAIAMVFSNLIILLVEIFAPPKESQAADLSYTGDAIVFITTYAFCSLPTLLTIAAAFGAGVGSLGGLIGRLFYRDPFEEEDEQMAMSVAQAQYLGILPVPGAPGVPYPGMPYPPPSPLGYPPYPVYPPYQPEGGAPMYPYPPAQFAPPPPGAYPPPEPYSPYAPPAPPIYGYAPSPYAPPGDAYPMYAPPPPPDFTWSSASDDVAPSKGFQPEPPQHT